MFEVLVGLGVTYSVGFSAWVVNAIFDRPTKHEVYRIEDRIISEMKNMEERLVGEIRANH